MEEFIKKIETYNIINYLLPGIIFTIIFTYLTEINILNDNAGIAIVEYYFIGLVLSRIGSIIIKPILKGCKIIDEEKYEDFIDKEVKDEKIPILVREGNQYRTFIATFVVLIIIEINNIIQGNHDKWMTLITFITLIVLFILSYRKQLIFITKRIKNK
ncbi:MAG: hypothetical protein Q4D02_01330 [Clostridia bacterium]|nr:hypothetical protein [Clostridia bacterium]